MARRRFVGGNWKMNWDQSLFSSVATSTLEALNADNAPEVVLFPPTPFIDTAKTILGDLGASKPPLCLGSQNVHHLSSGAYTGEVSAEMVLSVGAKWTLVGHSERRTHCGEDDAIVAAKASAALASGLGVVACVGESLSERESGATEAVIISQLRPLVDAVQPILRDCTSDSFVIAYEPVWAIGTGRSATAEDISKVHQAIRAFICSRGLSASIRIIYGGSVSAANAHSIISSSNDVDGFLVGGASMKPKEFATIVRAAA
jgi:triosephosphate isomerase